MITYTNAVRVIMFWICCIFSYLAHRTLPSSKSEYTVFNWILDIVLTPASTLSTPPEIAGTVGAIFNSGLQLGLALGLAIITSIVQSQNKKKIAKGEAVGYSGIADGYW